MPMLHFLSKEILCTEYVIIKIIILQEIANISIKNNFHCLR